MKDRELVESILKITREHPEYSYNYKQIAAVLGVKDSFIRKRIVTVLQQLSKNGTLEETERGKYQIKEGNKELVGHIQTRNWGHCCNYTKLKLVIIFPMLMFPYIQQKITMGNSPTKKEFMDFGSLECQSFFFKIIIYLQGKLFI